VQLTSLTHGLIAKAQYNFPFVQQQVIHKSPKLIENKGLCLWNYAERDINLFPKDEEQGKGVQFIKWYIGY
jgi:hypothetical protein